MVELSKEEQDSIAKDIADSKQRLSAKEKATDEALAQAKAEAKAEVLKELEEQRKAEAEAREKDDLKARIKALEDEKTAQEEAYKRKLDAAISSQAVVTNVDPFAGKSKEPSGSSAISSLTEEQMDDIETRSRMAFEEHARMRK